MVFGKLPQHAHRHEVARDNTRVAMPDARRLAGLQRASFAEGAASLSPRGAEGAAAEPEAATWAAILAGRTELRRGERGDLVEELQRKLTKAGFPEGADGIFGGGTERSVKNLQSAYGLDVTGVVDARTAETLDKIIAGTLERIWPVDYHGRTVSDDTVRAALQRIANKARATVHLTSGDRNYVPQGGARRSRHLHGAAADFYIEGQSLEQTFQFLRDNEAELFPENVFGIIWHGSHTVTGGPHIHFDNRGEGNYFFIEGTTPGNAGSYQLQ